MKSSIKDRLIIIFEIVLLRWKIKYYVLSIQVILQLALGVVIALTVTRVSF